MSPYLAVKAMHEIDFEVMVEAPHLTPREFMDVVETNLYARYEGDVSPVIRDGIFLISATVETEPLNFSEAAGPILRDIEKIGLRIKRFEIVNTLEVA